eukprot:scaffold265550_cov34-Prasinocladus_malaysianus.AAC.1
MMMIKVQAAGDRKLSRRNSHAIQSCIIDKVQLCNIVNVEDIACLLPKHVSNSSAMNGNSNFEMTAHFVCSDGKCDPSHHSAGDVLCFCLCFDHVPQHTPPYQPSDKEARCPRHNKEC